LVKQVLFNSLSPLDTIQGLDWVTDLEIEQSVTFFSNANENLFARLSMSVKACPWLSKWLELR
jgi:hypothetical protein